MVEFINKGERTTHIGRRSILGAIGGASIAGLAGCMGGDNSGDGNGDTGSGDEDPYFRQELTNAIDNLAAPAPGGGSIAFETQGSFQANSIECSPDREEPDNPDRGNVEAFFEFENGEEFSAELSRADDLSSLQNTITLTIPNPDDEGPPELAVPRSLRGIKPDAGSEGRSAFVIRDGGTWYGGIGFDPFDDDSQNFGETWVAITCPSGP